MTEREDRGLLAAAEDDNAGLVRWWRVRHALTRVPTAQEAEHLRRDGWTVYEDRAELRCLSRSAGAASRAAGETAPGELRRLLGKVTAVVAEELP